MATKLQRKQDDENSEKILSAISDITGITYSHKSLSTAGSGINLTYNPDSTEQRVLKRFISEESVKQSNIESIANITSKSLSATADMNSLSKDWLINYLDKAKLISEAEMQALWAKVLSSEAEAPGSFSKRTINALALMSSDDAESFELICRFKLMGDDGPLLFISSHREEIYKNNGLNYGTLLHMASIGLVQFQPTTAFSIAFDKYPVVLTYGKDSLKIFSNDNEARTSVGTVIFSEVGFDLASICNSEYVEGFVEHTVDVLKRKGVDARIVKKQVSTAKDKDV